jgi:aromatic ring-opening dioxygenase catalytic subunit (LigB family)
MPSNPKNQAQIVYFSHGGGPLPILGDPGHKAMVEFMRHLPSQLHRPDAIVVISAHWEEKQATLLGAANPPMLYDYYGFPEEAYQINYPAPGDPGLAQRIANLLEQNGIPARIDPARGFDHGHFIPLKLMYPKADIPSIQLSLLRGLDPAKHLAVGRALTELLPENILIIGSGFSFHNMRAFSWGDKVYPDPANDAFQDWLIDTIANPVVSPEEREERLLNWEEAPNARYCHPREEHLLPLFVCAALAGKPAKIVFDDLIFGKRGLAFLWQWGAD